MKPEPVSSGSSIDECPRCGCPESQLLATRRRTLRIAGQEVGSAIEERACRHCGWRFRTSRPVRPAAGAS